MPLFLLVYALIYGSIQLYIVFWIRRAWPESRWLLVTALCCAAAMVAGPILVQFLKRHGDAMPAQMLGVFLYSWFAWSFWFLAAGAGVDFWNLALRGVARLYPQAMRWGVEPRMAVACIGSAILLASAWGVIEASRPRLETVRLTINRLPEGFEPIRIVQISDLHLGLINRPGVLRKTIEIVQEARPDVIVSTGDLLDAPPHNLPEEIEWLSALDAPLGKFAVFGNHEVYVGRSESQRFHDQAGFQVVHGEYIEVGGNRLIIAGVDESMGPGGERQLTREEKIPLPRERPDIPVVLLKHRPLVAGDSIGRFDLQLSGHTHAGQIFPFGWVVGLFHMYSEGLHGLGRDSWIYVSRGTGSWGPPMRLFAPPEVTLVVLAPPA